MADLTVCAVGLKGAQFLAGLAARGVVPARVMSYPQADDHSDSFIAIVDAARLCGAKFEETRRPIPGPQDLVFIVGWQYLLADLPTHSIVFHDSLLPRYRGFAPTATALIVGDTEIGVTALQPTDRADEGPIYAQARMDVVYPFKIVDALQSQARMMADLAVELVEQWRAGTLVATPQNDSDATYSLWRNEHDYRIDWFGAAADIARFVDAVGHPYAGAYTSLEGRNFTVNAATPMDDLTFALRQPGKIFMLDADRPVVVCGQGLLRIDDYSVRDGPPIRVGGLRKRFI